MLFEPLAKKLRQWNFQRFEYTQEAAEAQILTVFKPSIAWTVDVMLIGELLVIGESSRFAELSDSLAQIFKLFLGEFGMFCHKTKEKR